jgi:type I restriction enzyme S subunit
MIKNKQQIPEGWEIRRLDRVFSLSAGGDVDKNKFSLIKTEKYPYPIYANALTNEGLYGYSSDYKIKNDAITITGRGDIGKVFFRKCFFTPIVRLVVAIPKNGISAEYMSYACSLIHFYNETTGVPQLTVPQVSRYHILVPPLPEQKRIAEVLGCWDEGIEKLEKIITLKEQQKKGLMQRLLTGKTRLRGFSEPWKEVKLGDICNIIKGKQLNVADMIEYAKYPALNGGVSPSGYTDDWNTEANTITISEGGNSCGYVNFMKERFWSGGHCYSLQNLKIDKIFLYQMLKNKENEIMGLRVGSGLPNIQMGSLNIFKITAPDELEQSAIASILSTADDEISQLKQKLFLFKQQKKWLMQQLLTGKKRLKIKKEN